MAEGQGGPPAVLVALYEGWKAGMERVEGEGFAQDIARLGYLGSLVALAQAIEWCEHGGEAPWSAAYAARMLRRFMAQHPPLTEHGETPTESLCCRAAYRMWDLQWQQEKLERQVLANLGATVRHEREALLAKVEEIGQESARQDATAGAALLMAVREVRCALG